MKANKKSFKYILILAAAFFWPWIAVALGDGNFSDPATITSLGMLSTIIIGSFIVYKETRVQNIAYRLGAALTLATAFLLNWAIPAVGVLGRDGDPADLMYTGVIAVGLTLAVTGRFQPHIMFRALAAMSIAQMAVAGIALIAGMHNSPISSVSKILVLNGFFAVLWIGAGLLFAYAAKKQISTT